MPDDVVISELCVALTEADVTTALLTRFCAADEQPADLHDPGEWHWPTSTS